MLGDINNDSQLNAANILLLQQEILSAPSLDPNKQNPTLRYSPRSSASSVVVFRASAILPVINLS
jgi:uncharacterized protein YqjF (DUF2071 family)